MKKQHVPNFARFVVLALLGTPMITWGNDCQQANTLNNRSLNVSLEQKGDLLNQALKLCPNHIHALNNLATLREQQGQLSEAEGLYKQAIKADPNFAPAYAGLGDVLMQQKDYRTAAEMFDKFLTTASNNQSLQKHVQHYEQRLEEAHNNIIIPAKEIRVALSGDRFGKPKIQEVPINFALNSYQVTDKGQQQCQEMANAILDVFNTNRSQHFRVRIEGHTDSQGKADFNYRLSEQRATSVKNVLVNNFNVPANRLVVVGFGEGTPIASNETAHGRFLNRRVTLVRLNK